MMPVLASTLDQSVESMVPYVVSGFLDEGERVVMRRKEVTQTLFFPLVFSKGVMRGRTEKRGNSQQPQRKHTIKPHLVAPRHLQLPDDPRRQSPRQDIPQNIVDRIGIPESRHIDALAEDAMIPRPGHRYALHDGGDDADDGVDGDVDHDETDGEPEARVLRRRENAEVELEHGDFCGVDGAFVENLREPECLLGVSDAEKGETRVEKEGEGERQEGKQYIRYELLYRPGGKGWRRVFLRRDRRLGYKVSGLTSRVPSVLEQGLTEGCPARKQDVKKLSDMLTSGLQLPDGNKCTYHRTDHEPVIPTEVSSIVMPTYETSNDGDQCHGR